MNNIVATVVGFDPPTQNSLYYMLKHMAYLYSHYSVGIFIAMMRTLDTFSLTQTIKTRAI